MKTLAACVILVLGLGSIGLCYVGVGLAVADALDYRFAKHCPGHQHGPRWMAGIKRPITIAIWPIQAPILGLDALFDPGRVCDRFDS